MKKTLICVMTFILLAGTLFTAQARNTIYMLPIKDAMASAPAGTLDDSVKLYFGDQKYPKPLKKWTSAVSNRKTNAFGKSDRDACNWVYLSAVKQLQKTARDIGANAVINVVSYYGKRVMSSQTKFECRAGTAIAGVALKGEFAQIP